MDILNTHVADPCCSKPFLKTARTGALDLVESWTCPKCSCEWKPRLLEGGIRHWEPHVYVAIVR
jgi:hypothetical protein